MTPAADTAAAVPAAAAFRMVRRGPNRIETALLVAAIALPVIWLLYLWEWEMLSSLLRAADLLVIVLLVLLGVPLAYWQQARFARSARLVVDAQGLAMHSGLPRFLQVGVAGDWRLRWEDVERATVLERFGVVHIKRKGGALKPLVSLRPADWVAQDSPARTANLRESQLWQALERHGLFGRAAPDPRFDAITFDLWRHPATRGALLAGAALLAYAIVDPVVRREDWADFSQPYIVPHAVAGILALAVSAAMLAFCRVPRRVPGVVVAVLALSLGFCAATASYSALIRVNQLAAGPLETKVYRRNASCDALVPLEPGLPEIGYTKLAREYWCGFPADALHEVPVRKGLFGLYQVDLTAHTEAIRRFREKR